MICISIGTPSLASCREIIAASSGTIRLMEIRLDGSQLSIDEIRDIFALPVQTIATCRPSKNHNQEERKHQLLTAIRAGVGFVDIEIETPPAFKQELIAAAKENNCRVIISYHNFETTPPVDELEHIVARSFQEGADIAKIACQTHSPLDSARILSLYAFNTQKETDSKSSQLLAIGMGEHGKITRIAAPYLGAPFTYAAPSEGNQTAPGQIDHKKLEKIYQMIDNI